MNFLFTMAGEGRRFREAGYTLPKMMIEAKGKTLLEWSVDSLPLQLCSRLIFIGQQSHETEYQLSAKIRNIYGDKVADIRFHFLNDMTRGQAETAYIAKELVLPDLPLLIFNIDTRFASKGLAEKLEMENVDGVLGAFSSEDPRFSFAEIDESGFVTRTAEKEVISANALTGLYHFKYPADFFEAADKAMKNNETTKGEFYIAPLYNTLISKGRKLVVDVAEEVDILGTPEELELFLKN